MTSVVRSKHAQKSPAERAERLATIARMRAAGVKWSDISTALGLKANGAHAFWRGATGYKAGQARAKTVAERPQSIEEWIRKWLEYDPETGEIYCRLEDGTRKRAEYPHRGYLRITARRRGVLAHRCAWFLHYGEWPEGQLDHRDRNGCNNRIANLRPATKFNNSHNKNRKRDGFKGVDRAGSRWLARIGHHKKQTRIGLFDSPEEAARAYDAAALRLHGEFAATNADLGRFSEARS